MTEGWLHFISLEKKYPAPEHEETQSEYHEKPNQMAVNFQLGLKKRINKQAREQKQKMRLIKGM